MNLEICEKCLNDTRIEHFRENCKGYLKSYDINTGCGDATYLNLYFGNFSSPEYVCCISKVIDPNIKCLTKKTFKKIELIDKKCPYFLEHQLYDWNKGKQK